MEAQEDKIIEKIAKLMAVANGTAAGGEHERDTALRMATKLLIKHNLSMVDIVGKTKAEARNSTEAEHYTDPWRRVCAGAIARLYFCGFFTTKINGKQKLMYTFIGLQSNIETAHDMANYVIKSIDREAKRLRKAQGQPASFETSFMNAAAGRISARCDALRAEAEAETQAEQAANAGNALVLANYYDSEKLANDEYVAFTMNIKLKSKPNRLTNLNNDGYAKGHKFGGDLSLNNQLKAPSATTLKIGS